MSPRNAAALALPILFAIAAPALAEPRVEAHSIEVRLDPATSAIEVTDKMTVVRDGGGRLEFQLNVGLDIREAIVDGHEATGLVRVGDDDEWMAQWRVAIPPGTSERSEVTLRYSGKIADQVRQSEDLSFVVGDDTRGVICPEGVYLSDGSGWFPYTGTLARFDVNATIPEPYKVVTQGTRDGAWWRGKYPADGLALVAGKWKHEERKSGGITIGTYLSEENAAHAGLLLDAAAKYLGVYSDLLGPYGYDRFDVVENWFTTGFGMPEFTLLGKLVIRRMVMESQRMGSIPAGYLDHEIVHCWWGNLVYPDYATGNWCEGLTSYCSNYWAKEREGPDAAREHLRRNAVRFTIRARPERDYPVRKFRGKSEDVDDDIGYGKASMLFHMLRRDIGDEAFWGTLRRVSQTRRGQRFSWDDWRAEFETTSKRNLADFFTQWLDRTGAPLLMVEETETSADGGRMRVSATLRQVLREGEAPWTLSVPVSVEHLEGVEQSVIDTRGETTRFTVLVPSLPLRISVDPDFQVFRRLASEEVPPCLAAALERPRKIVIHPDDDAALAGVAAMIGREKGAEVMPASKAPLDPPKGMSVIVLGDPERVPMLRRMREKMPRHFPGARTTAETTVLASARNPADEEEFLTTFTGAPAAVANRARAILHYQFDGRVVFEGSVLRERGPVPTPSRTQRTLLPDIRAAVSPERARRIVDQLASPEMKGRLAGSTEEKRARDLAVAELTMAGLDVDVVPFSFTVKSLDPDRPALRVGDASVEGALPLVASPATADAIVAVGVATDPEAQDLAGRALLLDIPAGTDDPMTFVRGTASLAHARGAVALLLRAPEQPSKEMLALWQFPGGDLAAHQAAATATRTGGTQELALPTVVVPSSFLGPKGESPLHVDAAFRTQEITSANVVARLASGARTRDGAVLLGAHLDHLGEGFPGADDDASGVAAVIEATHALAAHPDLLARDVLVVLFGAEEWGLRGSRAYVAGLPKGAVVAAITADTIGRRGVADVNVIGISMHPRLAKIAGAAVEQTGLAVGRDIDRMAFAHGSDHYAFHVAGIPAVDLFAGDYAVMHTSSDTPDQVDEQKVARIGRALALAALAVAGGY